MATRTDLARLTDWDAVTKMLENSSDEKTRTIKIPEMCENLKQRIRGQDEVIDQVVSQLSIRWRQKNRKLPIARFMFAGPTGTGKSELAKAISDYLYGEKTAVGLDCNNLQESQNLADLVGHDSVYQNSRPGRLTKPLIDNPRRVVVFEEIEKAHPRLSDIFLSEGQATDLNLRRDADFTQAIFILTSNAEQEELAKIAAEVSDPDERSEKIRRHLSDRKVFRPEIVARFDEIFVFKPLSTQVIAQIALMRLSELATSYSLRLVYVEAVLLVEATERIVKRREFGAREAPRVIEKMFGSALLDAKDHGAEAIQLSVDAEGNLRIDPPEGT